MTVNELEAKCREAIDAGYRIDINPKLILQLIEERRLLARLADSPGNMICTIEWRSAMELRNRVLQEIDQCKS